MARVRTLREHGNAYGLDEPGVDYTKREGQAYDHPAPQHLIDEHIVEAVDPLDHDANGRKGGSRRKPPAKPAGGE